MNFDQSSRSFLLPLLLGVCFSYLPGAWAAPFLRSNDVICSIGGANVVSADEFGYLETYLRVSFPDLNLRFRGLGHEGDTVSSQPRDYNYPAIPKQLEQVGATVVLARFGQSEALQGTEKLPEFIAAYEQLLGKLEDRRIALISPMPFERADRPLPDLSLKNSGVRAYVVAIKALAEKRNVLFIDLFNPAQEPKSGVRLTTDGFHLSAAGHARYDWMTAERLGARLAGAPPTVNDRGEFSPWDRERIRQAVVAKNRLWFAYYRPMNWAFLDGDRVDQPSSRDHLNPKIRWFPDEIKRFLPMIDKTENQIANLAATEGRAK